MQRINYKNLSRYDEWQDYCWRIPALIAGWKLLPLALALGIFAGFCIVRLLPPASGGWLPLR